MIEPGILAILASAFAFVSGFTIRSYLSTQSQPHLVVGLAAALGSLVTVIAAF